MSIGGSNSISQMLIQNLAASKTRRFSKANSVTLMRFAGAATNQRSIGKTAVTTAKATRYLTLRRQSNYTIKKSNGQSSNQIGARRLR